MRRAPAFVAGTAGLAILLSGCASADAQAQVDEFCTQVEQLVRKANQYAKNPANTALGNEVTATGQALIEQAPGLATVVATNPALAPRLQECTAELQNIGTIEGGEGKGNN